jgi:hypothetical protein
MLEKESGAKRTGRLKSAPDRSEDRKRAFRRRLRRFGAARRAEPILLILLMLILIDSAAGSKSPAKGLAERSRQIDGVIPTNRRGVRPPIPTNRRGYPDK